MNLDGYIKKSSNIKRDYSQKQKNCMSCGRQLDNKGTHLWFQGFCSEKCKEDYLIEAKEL
ncbi:MAG TPA: hypothetical protein VI977_01475 [archaeon]|nr:hypothetical protein [archaeon]